MAINLNETLDELQPYPWFFGNISAKAARCLLMFEKPGTFLIRHEGTGRPAEQNKLTFYLSVMDDDDTVKELKIAHSRRTEKERGQDEDGNTVEKDVIIEENVVCIPECRHKDFKDITQLVGSIAQSNLAHWHPFPRTKLISFCPIPPPSFYTSYKTLTDQQIDTEALMTVMKRSGVDTILSAIGESFPGYVGDLRDPTVVEQLLRTFGNGTWMCRRDRKRGFNRFGQTKRLDQLFLSILVNGSVRNIEVCTGEKFDEFIFTEDSQMVKVKANNAKELCQQLTNFPAVGQAFKYENAITTKGFENYPNCDLQIIGPAEIPTRRYDELLKSWSAMCTFHGMYVWAYSEERQLITVVVNYNTYPLVLPVLSSPEGMFFALHPQIKHKSLKGLMAAFKDRLFGKGYPLRVHLGDPKGAAFPVAQGSARQRDASGEYANQPAPPNPPVWQNEMEHLRLDEAAGGN